MKLMFSSSKRFKYPFQAADDLCKFVRVLLYSTETLTWKEDSLYSRISPLGNPGVSIVPVLEQWAGEGKPIIQEHLQSVIKKLRVYKRFRHALEISQWMTDRRFFGLSTGEVAIRLDLIAKVHGLEQAEKYFENIPKKHKGLYAYGTLLNCYAHEKSLEKAEAHMQKMKDMGYAKHTLPYNLMLGLYSHVGQHEKLETVMEEMKEKGIHWDKFTFSTRLGAYATTSDIDGMKKILKRMEADPEITMDWNPYAVAANGFIKAGLIEQALEMLIKSEKLIDRKSRKEAYEFFLTLYGSTGTKVELYRIWKLYKSSTKAYNTAYIRMISSLLKLDDIEAAEKILLEWEAEGTSFDFRVPNLIRMISSLLKLDDIEAAEKILLEWEAEGTSFDFRVPNLLIAAYCKKGLIGKAETMIHNAVEKGKKPLPSTWDSLATGYLENNQIRKVVETMRKAILSNRPGWNPNRVTLVACLEYLVGQGDIEGAEEFVSLLKSPGPLPNDVCVRLLNYMKDEKPQSSPSNEMDGDNLDVMNQGLRTTSN